MKRAYLFFGLRLFSLRAAEKSYRKMRGAVLAIGLSLVPLIVVLQVADGMIEGITQRYLEVSSFHLQVRTFEETDDDTVLAITESIRRTAGVRDAFPVVEGLALARGDAGKSGVAVRALPSGLYARDERFRGFVTVQSGEFDLSREDSVLVSADASAKLGVEVGDELRLLTARTLPGDRLLPRQSTLRVRGIVTSGYHDLDALTLIVSLDKGKQVFRDPGAEFVAVKLTDPFGSASAKAAEIRRLLPPGWYVYTWFEVERAMYNEFRTTKSMLIVVMALIVLVATTTISGSLVTLIAEKQPEIAVLKSMGGTNAGITTTFVFAGFLSGVVGTILGVAGGLAVAVNINEIIRVIEAAASTFSYLGRLALSGSAAHIEWETIEVFGSSYYLDAIPITIRAADVLLVAVLSIVLSTVSAWWPARSASRVDPVEFLQHH